MLTRKTAVVRGKKKEEVKAKADVAEILAELEESV